jgi:RES domain-containing protein
MPTSRPWAVPHARGAYGPLRTRGFACRGESLPSDTSLDLISDKPNRWNVQGEATVYVSGDAALALTESGRHPDDLEKRVRLLEVDLTVPLVVDLRDRDVRVDLSLPDDPGWVLDAEQTRQVAQSIRHSKTCDGLIVPSAGALDQPDRFNIVVFADDRSRIPRMVRNLRVIGNLCLDSAGSTA